MTTRKPELRPLATRAAIATDDLPAWWYDHLKRYPVLSSEAEQELLAKIAAGDLEARQLLIEHNYRLIMFVARRYRYKGLEYDDLVQEGVFGLARAVDRFRLKKGKKFSTYATWWIRQAVSRAIMDQGHTIRLPVYMHTTARREQREQLATSWEPMSLDTIVTDHTRPFHAGRPNLVSDTIADPTEETDETAAENVDRANAPAVLTALFDRARIRPRDRLILLARAEGEALESIAARQRPKLSRERVRQIVARCLIRLRDTAGTTDIPLSDMFTSFIA